MTADRPFSVTSDADPATDVTEIAIDDPEDARVAAYRRLNEPAHRREVERDGLFVAEGPTSVERLLASDHHVRSVLVSTTKIDRARPLLADHPDVDLLVAPPEVLDAIVGFHLQRGMVAVAERRPLATVDELIESADRIVVLEGLNDPENLGAIARTARALGVDRLLLDPRTLDPYYRRAVRVSMGEILHCRVARATRWPDDLDRLHAAGFDTWALTPAATADDLFDLAVPARLALVLGAEGPGLTAATLERATRRVRIPITPGVDSLNVGAAAAVALAVTRRVDRHLP
jgi:tRNA G18 (ribose-2'-O)-methylase SpoU